MINTVREIAKEIANDSYYVFCVDEKIEEIANKIAENQLEVKWNAKLPTANNRVLTTEEIIQYEVIAGSINYCYWYGHGNMRPLGASSRKMYSVLNETINMCDGVKLNKGFLNTFFYTLVKNRFPLLEERHKHLMELAGGVYHEVAIDNFITRVKNGMMEEALHSLVTSYPGYASDLFLKRAQLTIIQLQRSLQPFEKSDIKMLTIPADYQVPKLLYYNGCLNYHNELLDDINESKLIPKGSRKEIEIRAATIVACDKIAEYSGTNCMVVDNYLWQMKDEVKIPFHLTVTTDY